MKTRKKLIIVILVLVALAVIGTVIAEYGEYTSITAVDITSHNDYETVSAGYAYTLTCSTSTDTDSNGCAPLLSDTVTHTWSGAGTFDPQTGTSVIWTAPLAAGDVNITVTASDDTDPNYADDPNVSDTVILTVQLPPVYYVDVDANGDSNGLSWANAFVDLQDALTLAGSGQEIWVAEGTYYPDLGDEVDVNDRSETFQLVASSHLYGGFDGNETTLSQRDWENNVTILSGDINEPNDANDNSYHVVTGADNAVLNGFTITGGHGDLSYSHGGGMYNSGVNPTIGYCVFEDNTAYISAKGGGHGGGMYNSYSNATVTNCEFIGNDGTSGGGMYNYESTATVTNCVFRDNTATDGGGIGVSHCSPSFINCTVVNNSSSSDGGGMRTYSSTASIINCIFWDNQAGGDGNEIYNADTDPDISYSCIKDSFGGGSWDSDLGTNVAGNIDDDPCFVNPDTNDYELSPESSCIDAADGDEAAAEDIDGSSRVDDPFTTNTGTGDPNYSDIGAYEFNPKTWSVDDVVYVDEDATGNDDGTSWANAYNDLQDAISAAGGDEIWVAEGTYYPDGSDPDNRALSFEIGFAYGGFDANETARSQRDAFPGNTHTTTLSGAIGGAGDADNSYHVVKASSAGTIDGFTITKGYAYGSSDSYKKGGGVYGGAGTIRNCYIYLNKAELHGGGLYNFKGALENSRISQNETPHASGNQDCYGGAIANTTSGIYTARAKNCLFYGNKSYRGGAIYIQAANIELTNCVFETNRSWKAGGGIYSVAGVTITNCTFYKNYYAALVSAGGYGGALAIDNGSAYIENSILWDNYTSYNPPFYNNKPKQIYIHEDVDGGYIDFSDFEGMYTVDDSGPFESESDDNLDEDPNFVNADGRDFSLDGTSNCIDAANGNVDPNTDKLGNSRYDDPNTSNNGIGDPNYVDMGAYEYQGS